MRGCVDGDGEGVASANHLLGGGYTMASTRRFLIRIDDALLIWKGGRGNGVQGLNIHFSIFEDGGAEFLLDVADAVGDL